MLALRFLKFAIFVVIQRWTDEKRKLTIIYNIYIEGNSMYNKLYLVHRKDDNDDIYWTQIGNDEQRSMEYRKQKQKDYTASEFDNLTDFTFVNARDTKIAQLTVNNVFKEWTNRGNNKNMQITIGLTPEEMKHTVTDIVSHIADDDYIGELMECLHRRFTQVTKSKVLNLLLSLEKEGYVYLLECENNKYKIGMSNNVNRRFSDLQNDEHYKAICIVDSFRSKDASHDEAMLHKLCGSYKQNRNGTINWLQDVGNSEMFSKCDEVLNIWNEYKSKLI